MPNFKLIIQKLLRKLLQEVKKKEWRKISLKFNRTKIILNYYLQLYVTLVTNELSLKSSTDIIFILSFALCLVSTLCTLPSPIYVSLLILSNFPLQASPVHSLIHLLANIA